MPELPDIETYAEALRERIDGRPLLAVRIRSPFVLRTVDPPPAACAGRRVTSVGRVGKRLVIGLEGERWIVLHLMIAGRLHWKPPGAPLAARAGLAAFDFADGTLALTEAGTRRRAALHLLDGPGAPAALDRGGLDVRAIDTATFARRLRSENHTLKRALTDPRLFDGIGNAWSDEILHAARLSPLALTTRLDDAAVARLHAAARATLERWIVRLREERAGAFPARVTAFRPGMAVHGRFGRPCPDCGAPVQRIRYADTETNYCARCQTGGRRLADRALSRLLREDWPRSIDEVE
jgi:formamidopyrimidine-DNA glycosylase